MEIISGRLTADAEVRTVNSGAQVVNFSIAKNRTYKNKKGEQVKLTEYVDCAHWVSTQVAKFLTKGTSVMLKGWMSTRAWTDKDGQAHARLNFTTDNIDFLGGGIKIEAPQQGQTPQGAEEAKLAQDGQGDIDDDLPF